MVGAARLHKAGSNRYILRLYVAGQTPKSVDAITNINKICEENLKGRYMLDVIDLYQQPQLAQERTDIGLSCKADAKPNRQRGSSK